jgi:molybdate transport system substrate-binding protein
MRRSGVNKELKMKTKPVHTNRHTATRRSALRLACWLSCGLALASMAAQAEDVQVAVAANFAGAFQKIAAGFTASTGHKVVSISGSTGKFYTQIQQGAPFEVLLAADDDTPAKLEGEGLAVKGQQFTYAIGKLVLWSAKPDGMDKDGNVLKKGEFTHLALANPKLAPYGAAGMEALKALNLMAAVQPKIVQGENIAQAFQFVATGNAEIGFVALAQVAAPDKPAGGSYWLVPTSLYSPIRQDAALLNKGADNPAAKALLAYLKGDAAKAVIQSYGYGL